MAEYRLNLTAEEIEARLNAKMTLGLHTDGLIYLFVDGEPVGNGIALPSGASGDVVGNVDSENNIVLMGNLTDGTYSVKYEMDDGSTVNIGELVLDSNVYCSVTKNLTNCTISNGATSVIEGESYSATITANDGYELSSVVVTMGGENVSVTGGSIYIESVTGDIHITAEATEIVQATNFFKTTPTATTEATDGLVLGGRFKSDGSFRADGGGDCLLTHYINVMAGDIVEMHNLAFYDASNIESKMYKSDKSAIGAFLSTNTAYVTNVSKTGTVQTFTVAHTDAGYIRICGRPDTSIQNGTGADVSVKYDLSQIVIKIKRNGVWL